MTRRLLLAVLAALCLLPTPAHAEVGDLQKAWCTEEDPLEGFSDCADAPGPTSKPVFSPDGTHAYTTDAGVIARWSRAPGGALTYLGCIGYTGAEHSCTATAPGLFFGHSDLAISPDGNEIYVTVTDNNLGPLLNPKSTLVHLNRAGDGSLSFGSCIAHNSTHQFGCGSTHPQLFGTQAPVVAPGGNDLYISAAGLVHLEVGSGGTPTFNHCYGRASFGCDGSTESVVSSVLFLSPDGSDLYAVTGDVQHYDRAGDGTLIEQGCLTNTAFTNPGCTVIATLDSTAFSGAISPDGASVYVGGGLFATRIIALDRAPNGALTYDSCIGALGQTACPAFRGLGSVGNIIVSPGNEWVYARGNGLSILRRAAGGGLTRIRCIQDTSDSAGCTEGTHGLFGAHEFAFPPGGAQLYIGGSFAITAFQRIEYVTPPPLDTTPLNEAQGTRRAAEPPAAAPATVLPPTAPPAASPGRSGPSPIVDRRLRNERVHRCLVRPACRRAAREAKVKRRRARRRAASTPARSVTKFQKRARRP